MGLKLMCNKILLIFRVNFRDFIRKIFQNFLKLLKEKEKPKKEETSMEEIKLPQKIKKVTKKAFSEAPHWILKEPHITEKATGAGEKNKYIFKVYQGANKIEVKKAVRDLYGVMVKDVNIINIHRKTKRAAGRTRGGHKSGYKKAIVTLYKGEKLELMPR